MRRLVLGTLLAGMMAGPAILHAQTPDGDLMTPPKEAQKFVLISTAGQHGTLALWRDGGGTVFSRESTLLRGMVWEEDEAIHLSRDGLPDRVTIRGRSPGGDASESFTVTGGLARWTSPVDSGSKASGERSFYLSSSSTWSDIAVLAERLLVAPDKRLPLLPGGEARLTRLTDLEIGDGALRKKVTAWAIDGLSFDPAPVWMDGDGKFFANVSWLALLPEAYAGSFSALQTAQEAALAKRSPAIVKQFGTVAAEPVAFTHVKLFDSEAGRYLSDRTVVFDKGKITETGAASEVAIPANARIIEGRGKALLPGLWDAHMHIADDSMGIRLLSLGVTSLRNPGTGMESSIERSRRVAAGSLLSPEAFDSVIIDGKGPLAAQGSISAGSAEEAVAAVRLVKEKGFAAVKFYTSMKPEWLVPAVAEAKKLGLHVHGHVPATMRPADAIAAGYDEITHINFVMMQAMPDAVVAASNGIMRFEGPGRYAQNVDISAEPLRSLIPDMAKKRIVVDPTLVAFESIFVPENGELSPAMAAYSGIMPPVIERNIHQGGFAVPKDLRRADYRASFAKLVDLTGALHRAGVPIVAGTDGGGLELVHELELYVSAGLTPAEALQTATINPARLVGADARTGSIAAGKEADLVLVDGDPEVRIGDLRHTEWVVSNGMLMNADELRAAAGFLGRPK